MYIPTLNWEDVNMEFVIFLPLTRRQNDSIGVIVDTLAKSSNFIHVKFTYMAELYATIYIKVIVILYVIPLSITSDTIKDMLLAYVIYFKSFWDEQLSFIDFFYNNSYHSSISKDLFEAIYGRRCRSPVSLQPLVLILYMRLQRMFGS